MYHKILVPVNGSPFSEGILAYLPQVDDKEESQIILLQVLEQERYGPYLTPGPLPISGQPIAEWDQYAQSYHASLAQELRRAAIRCAAISPMAQMSPRRSAVWLMWKVSI